MFAADAIIIGSGPIVVHIGLVAMTCEASANLFADICLNVPTLGTLYKIATLNALQTIPRSDQRA